MDIRSGQVRFSLYWTISHLLELQEWYATLAKWIGMTLDGSRKEEAGREEP